MVEVEGSVFGFWMLQGFGSKVSKASHFRDASEL